MIPISTEHWQETSISRFNKQGISSLFEMIKDGKFDTITADIDLRRV